ncbi:alpha/beta fold hydrolase [Chamaesiphon sp.]|uniref:alpha/beta fold hydrolase n=1 Tax=Chamaesiphon sp. TaxID=2814140 RepID=UPI0035941327
MSKILWVSASPSFKYFHRRLLKQLSKVVEIELWEYHQTLDEGSSIDSAIDLLHEYITGLACPVHLIGHGIGGAIALGYARIYPERVASSILLSVAVQPATDWHSYYYTQLRASSECRERVVQSIAVNLFPHIYPKYVGDLVARFSRDLVEAPSNHSLFRLEIQCEGGVEMPMMICSSQDDPVITSTDLSGWNNYLKSTDVSWCSVTGGHFFHHFHPQLVSHQIHNFWQRLESKPALYQLDRVDRN